MQNIQILLYRSNIRFCDPNRQSDGAEWQAVKYCEEVETAIA